MLWVQAKKKKKKSNYYVNNSQKESFAGNVQEIKADFFFCLKLIFTSLFDHREEMITQCISYFDILLKYKNRWHPQEYTLLKYLETFNRMPTISLTSFFPFLKIGFFLNI